MDTGELATTLRIPDAIGPVTVRADLRSQQTLTSISIDAPKDGTPRGRFGWLMRQLKEAPGDLRLEAAFPNARSTTTATVDQMRENPKALEYEQEPKRPPRAFVLTRCEPMGKKRGRAEGSFVRDTSSQVISFYSDLVEDLKAWQAPAPKLHSPQSAETSETPARESQSENEPGRDRPTLPSSRLVDGEDDAPPAVAVPLG